MKVKRKKKLKFSYKVVFSLLLILFMISYKFFIRDFYMNKFINKEEAKAFQGLITLWDNPSRTVIGSNYGFIKNAVSNFQHENELIQIELRELSFEGAKVLANEKAISKNHPDIISKYIENDITKTDNIMYDKGFVERINDTYNVTSISEDEERCIFPVFGSFNVIIVNKDVFDKMGISLPEKNWSYSTFIDIIREIKNKDTKKEKIPFDMVINKDSFGYMNFLLDNGYGNIGFKKLETLKKELEGYKCLSSKKSLEDVHYDLYNSKTMIYAGNMDDVNYLLRTKNRDNSFNFEVYPYPYENKRVEFVSDIKSYYLLNTDDNSRKSVLQNFIEHIYQNEGMNILNIQGKIPLFHVKYIKKDLKYDYLLDYINIEDYYSIEDKNFQLNQKDIYKKVKEIFK